MITQAYSRAVILCIKCDPMRQLQTARRGGIPLKNERYDAKLGPFGIADLNTDNITVASWHEAAKLLHITFWVEQCCLGASATARRLLSDLNGQSA